MDRISAFFKKIKSFFQDNGSDRKKTVLRLLAVVLALAVFAGAAAICYVNNLLGLIRRPESGENIVSQEQVNEILGYDPNEVQLDFNEFPEESTEPESSGPVSYGETGKVLNILLIGNSSREGESARLSDTIILCTVNKETKTLTLSSFLRDTFVQLPSPYKGHTCGKQRINVAYALGYQWGNEEGAMEYLDLTILNNFGVQVDFNVEIDFTAFVRAIDLLEGIHLELDEQEANYLNKTLANDPDREYHFEPGRNWLDGWAGLAYARMRHSSAADNDFKRTNRQRILIQTVLEKLRSKSLAEQNRFIREMLPYVLTDMSNTDIANCILELLPLLSDLTIETRQIPAEGTYTGKIVSISGVESGVLVPDLARNREILMAIAECDRMEQAEG